MKNAPQILQINASLLEKLFQVQPSRDGILEYRPCQITLRDGGKLDRVYLVEEEPYIKVWGGYPQNDPGKLSILLEQVIDLCESPYRLPAKLANKMYQVGESGMGYCVFTLIMKNGKKFPFVTGNAVDFPELPPEYSYSDILDLLPHVGREQLCDTQKHWINAPYTASAKYCWCLFRK